MFFRIRILQVIQSHGRSDHSSLGRSKGLIQRHFRVEPERARKRAIVAVQRFD